MSAATPQPPSPLLSVGAPPPQPSQQSQPSPPPQKALTASQQEALKRVTKIIDSFVLRPDCAPFLEPVDWRGLELYDYPTIIKKPMDLGTIKRKLERQQYPSAAYCVADVRRVWNNCLAYNTVGSDFYNLAKNCSKRFEDRYRRIRNEYDIGEEPPKSDVEENDTNEDDDDEEEQDEDEEMRQRGHRGAVSSRRRHEAAKMKEEDEDDDDDDEGENEFQGHEYDDDDDMGEEDEDDDDDEDAKTSDVSGSPGSANPSTQKKRQRSNTPPPLPTHAASSLDKKMQLTTSLLYLNGTDLGHVMSLLEQHCPNVLETNDTNKELQLPESMEMNMDLLMDEYYNVFTVIQNYCNDHMVKKRYAASAQGGNVVKIKDISNKRKERKT